jgi:hypothetical protein
MACKVLLFFSQCFLSRPMIQVSMGILSTGDAEALSAIDGSALY